MSAIVLRLRNKNSRTTSLMVSGQQKLKLKSLSSKQTDVTDKYNKKVNRKSVCFRFFLNTETAKGVDWLWICIKNQSLRSMALSKVLPIVVRMNIFLFWSMFEASFK